MRADSVSRVEVQAMRGLPIRSDARVEMNLLTAEAQGLLAQPVQQGSGMPLVPSGRNGRQVVDIQVPTPSQVVAGAKPRYCNGRGVVVLDRSDDAVPDSTLNCVDLLNECLPVDETRAQLAHGLERSVSFWWKQLDDHWRIVSVVCRPRPTLAPVRPAEDGAQGAGE